MFAVHLLSFIDIFSPNVYFSDIACGGRGPSRYCASSFALTVLSASMHSGMVALLVSFSSSLCGSCRIIFHKLHSRAWSFIAQYIHSCFCIVFNISYLYLQGYDIVLRDPTSGLVSPTKLSAYTINRDDLVINIHPSKLTTSNSMLTTQTINHIALATTTIDTTTATHSPDSYHKAPSIPTHSSASSSTNANLTAHQDLGIFSELILSIFTHELTTGYMWEVPQSSSLAAATVGSKNSDRVAPTGVKMQGNKRRSVKSARSSSLHTLPTYNTMSHHGHHLLATTTEPTLFNKAYTILSAYTTPFYTLLSGYIPVHSATTNHTTSTTSGTNNTNTTNGFCTVPNHSVHVRKFRTSPENFAFLIGADSGDFNDDDSVGMYGIGSVEEDMRYYSDGL